MRTLLGLVAIVILLGILSSQQPSTTTTTATTSTSGKTAEERAAAKAESDRKDAEEKVRKAAELANCRQDKSCWANKHTFTGTYECQHKIERMAKYEAQWTDGWLEVKFPRYRWRDWDKKILTHIGDKIKFQNGFGAWSPMIYECDVNLAGIEPGEISGKSVPVLDVRMREGRLSQ